MQSRLFVICAVTATALMAADVRIVEEIVAKINGDIVTRGELEKNRNLLALELRGQGMSGAKLDTALRDKQKDVLRDQIDQLLLVQKGKDLNISVDADITRRLADIQVQAKISDPDKFHDYIREQSSMSFEDFKAQMKNTLLTQRVISQEVTGRMLIPREQKQKYYEEHKTEFVRQEQVFLRQILLSTEGKTPEQVAAAEKKAKDLVVRARKGEKFGELARDNSDDPETAKNMGELPPYKKGDMRKEIEDVVFKQRKGYVTDPIRIPTGFLILRIEERHEAGQAPFEEVENQIMEILAMPLMQPKVREYLTALRTDAFVQLKEGYLDSGAAPNKDTAWQDVAQLKPETTTKEEVKARKRRHILWVIPAGRKK